jgi:Cu2+-containing amine oxidase
MNIFDDDDFMSTTPKDNFMSIIKTANQNIVAMEIEKVLGRLALAEKMLEENGLEEEYESKLKHFAVSEPAEYDNRVNSLFIETVGNIVTQCE